MLLLPPPPPPHERFNGPQIITPRLFVSSLNCKTLLLHSSYALYLSTRGRHYVSCLPGPRSRSAGPSRSNADSVSTPFCKFHPQVSKEGMEIDQSRSKRDLVRLACHTTPAKRERERERNRASKRESANTYAHSFALDLSHPHSLFKNFLCVCVCVCVCVAYLHIPSGNHSITHGLSRIVCECVFELLVQRRRLFEEEEDEQQEVAGGKSLYRALVRCECVCV